MVLYILGESTAEFSSGRGRNGGRRNGPEMGATRRENGENGTDLFLTRRENSNGADLFSLDE